MYPAVQAVDIRTYNLFRTIRINKEVADGQIEGHASNMHKVLTVRDLTFMGIAAIVGAGIFSTIGKASFDGGPGIILLFLFISVACGFSAICYAEFASMVPVSGSAYTYSYVAFGEIIAWIIGWDLLMEYAIGNIAVAISWSDYFCSLINNFQIGSFHPHVPEYLATDYWTAKDQLTDAAKLAWANAPLMGGVRFICNIPAFLITFVITWVIYIGIRESRRTTNIMVILKIAIILLVMIAGCFYVNTSNWTPFCPMELVVYLQVPLLFSFPISDLMQSVLLPKNVKIRKEICQGPCFTHLSFAPWCIYLLHWCLPV